MKSSYSNAVDIHCGETSVIVPIQEQKADANKDEDLNINEQDNNLKEKTSRMKRM